MTTCATCGHATEAAFKFCPACGARADGSGTQGLVGTVLNGKYKVVRQIGQGAMGVVYEGEHVALQKRVALKVLHPDLEVTDDSLRRFQQEGIAAGRFTHPGAIQIFDFDRDGPRTLYLAMEYLDGVDLKSFLKRKGRLAPVDAVEVARQVLSVLAEAHALGIVHRDLKPDNVMVLRHSGEGLLVKVLDFGLSKLVDVPLGASLQTQVGRILGTPLYMAPEQVAGEDVDHRADIYAVGLILYELLAGMTPFPDQSTTEVLFSRATREAPSIRESFPDLGLTPELDVILRRALERRREDRYQGAEEMLADLDALGATTGDASTARVRRTRGASSGGYVVPPAGAGLPSRAVPRGALFGAALVVLLLAVGGLLLFGGADEDPGAGATQAPAGGAAPSAASLRARDPASLSPDARSYLERVDAARRALAAGDRDAALVHLGDAIALGQQDPEALLLRARLRVDAARPSEARADLEAVRAFAPAVPDLHVLAGWLELEDSRPERADEAFLAAEAANGGTYAPARAGRAAVALSAGRLDEAHTLAEAAVAADDALAVGHRLLGEVALAAGDAQAAVPHLTRARSRDAQDWRSALALARAYTALGELLKAERPLAAARASNPDALEVRRALAANYVARELWPEARDELRDALARHPGDGALLVLRGVQHEADGEVDDAVRALEAGLDAGVAGARAHALLGVLLHERGDELAARDHYEAARSLDDTLALPWLDLGLLSLRTGAWAEAIELLDGALERDADLHFARFALGVAQRDYAGDREAARATFAEYLERGGRDPRVPGWLEQLGG